MRKLTLSVALSFALVGSAAAAELSIEDFAAETTGSVVRMCSADEGTELGKYAVGFCYGWLEGVEQFYASMLDDERFNVKPIACPEKPLSRKESKVAFVEWAKANPDAEAMPPLEGLIRAAKELFPCA